MQYPLMFGGKYVLDGAFLKDDHLGFVVAERANPTSYTPMLSSPSIGDMTS